MSERTIRRCTKCVNKCELTSPRCKTGKELAAEKGIYEEENSASETRLRSPLYYKLMSPFLKKKY